jgi:hypothetical protein
MISCAVRLIATYKLYISTYLLWFLSLLIRISNEPSVGEAGFLSIFCVYLDGVHVGFCYVRVGLLSNFIRVGLIRNYILAQLHSVCFT